MDYEDFYGEYANRVPYFKLFHHKQERHTEKKQSIYKKNDVSNFKEYFLKE
jgi:hypothetical protein